jgi:hypothetical protein
MQRADRPWSIPQKAVFVFAAKPSADDMLDNLAFAKLGRRKVLLELEPISPRSDPRHNRKLFRRDNALGLTRQAQFRVISSASATKPAMRKGHYE